MTALHRIATACFAFLFGTIGLGVLFYHNTVTTETSAGSSANSHWRNNLMLGQDHAPPIFSVNTQARAELVDRSRALVAACGPGRS